MPDNTFGPSTSWQKVLKSPSYGLDYSYYKFDSGEKDAKVLGN